MKKLIYILVIVAVLAAVGMMIASMKPAAAPTAPVSSSSSPAITSGYFSQTANPTLGTYLTDKDGMTLYTFTHDSPGTSACTGACLDKWPPYGPGVSAASGTVLNLPMLPANVGTIAGNNGLVQFTWKGMPLYHYFEDKVSGDVSGQGVLNSWYVVKL